MWEARPYSEDAERISQGAQLDGQGVLADPQGAIPFSLRVEFLTVLARNIRFGCPGEAGFANALPVGARHSLLSESFD
jgi:hypothetical protein